jgi:hypothetical protein
MKKIEVGGGDCSACVRKSVVVGIIGEEKLCIDCMRSLFIAACQQVESNRVAWMRSEKPKRSEKKQKRSGGDHGSK